MNLYKNFFIVIIFIFCFSLLGCEEEKEKMTPNDIVEAFKENEKKHVKKPRRIDELPDMITF